MPKAGQNIHNLALRRRVNATLAFISAGFIGVFPFLIVGIFSDFLKWLPTAPGVKPTTISMPPLFYIAFIVIAAMSAGQGFYLLKRAKHADQGAKGEEEIAQVLKPLEEQGWELRYGTKLKGLGDVDVICTSPTKKVFVIDVKSHNGEIILTQDGKGLCRRMGQSVYGFEKDFVQQTMKQALQVKKQMNVKFVTPIVAFSRARVAIPSGKVNSVYVVDKANLLSLLKSL